MKFKLFILLALVAAVNLHFLSNSDTPSNNYVDIVGAHRLGKVYDHPVGTYSALLPDTGSMEPCLSVGDVAYVNELYPYVDLKVGDIIVYSPKLLLEYYDAGITKYKALIHRIEAIDEVLPNGDKTYKIKGDNNPRRDKFRLTKENFSGRVFKVEFDVFTKTEQEEMFRIKREALELLKNKLDSDDG